MNEIVCYIKEVNTLGYNLTKEKEPLTELLDYDYGDFLIHKAKEEGFHNTARLNVTLQLQNVYNQHDMELCIKSINLMVKKLLGFVVLNKDLEEIKGE